MDEKQENRPVIQGYQRILRKHNKILLKDSKIDLALRDNRLSVAVILSAVAEHRWDDAAALLPYVLLQSNTLPLDYFWRLATVIVMNADGLSHLRKKISEDFYKMKSKPYETALEIIFEELTKYPNCDVTSLIEWTNHVCCRAEVGKTYNDRDFRNRMRAFVLSYIALIYYCQYKNESYSKKDFIDLNESTAFSSSFSEFELPQEKSDAGNYQFMKKKERVNTKQALLYFREAIQYLEEPCEWLFGPYLDMLQNAFGYKSALEVLEKYMAKHSEHMPAHRLCYQFLEKFPQCKELKLKKLEDIAKMCPDDALMMTYVENLLSEVERRKFGIDELRSWSIRDVVKKCSNNRKCGKRCSSTFNSGSDVKILLKCLRLLMAMVEFKEWRWNVQPWEMLSHILRRIFMTLLKCGSCVYCRRMLRFMKSLKNEKLRLWKRYIWIEPRYKKISLQQAEIFFYTSYVAHVFNYGTSYVEHMENTLLNYGYKALAEDLQDARKGRYSFLSRFTAYKNSLKVSNEKDSEAPSETSHHFRIRDNRMNSPRTSSAIHMNANGYMSLKGSKTKKSCANVNLNKKGSSEPVPSQTNEETFICDDITFNELSCVTSTQRVDGSVHLSNSVTSEKDSEAPSETSHHFRIPDNRMDSPRTSSALNIYANAYMSLKGSKTKKSCANVNFNKKGSSEPVPSQTNEDTFICDDITFNEMSCVTSTQREDGSTYLSNSRATSLENGVEIDDTKKNSYGHTDKDVEAESSDAESNDEIPCGQRACMSSGQKEIELEAKGKREDYSWFINSPSSTVSDPFPYTECESIDIMKVGNNHEMQPVEFPVSQLPLDQVEPVTVPYTGNNQGSIASLTNRDISESNVVSVKLERSRTPILSPCKPVTINTFLKGLDLCPSFNPPDRQYICRDDDREKDVDSLAVREGEISDSESVIGPSQNTDLSMSPRRLHLSVSKSSSNVQNSCSDDDDDDCSTTESVYSSLKGLTGSPKTFSHEAQNEVCNATFVMHKEGSENVTDDSYVKSSPQNSPFKQNCTPNSLEIMKPSVSDVIVKRTNSQIKKEKSPSKKRKVHEETVGDSSSNVISQTDKINVEKGTSIKKKNLNTPKQTKMKGCENRYNYEVDDLPLPVDISLIETLLNRTKKKGRRNVSSVHPNNSDGQTVRSNEKENKSTEKKTLGTPILNKKENQSTEKKTVGTPRLNKKENNSTEKKTLGSPILNKKENKSTENKIGTPKQIKRKRNSNVWNYEIDDLPFPDDSLTVKENTVETPKRTSSMCSKNITSSKIEKKAHERTTSNCSDNSDVQTVKVNSKESVVRKKKKVDTPKCAKTKYSKETWNYEIDDLPFPSDDDGDDDKGMLSNVKTTRKKKRKKQVKLSEEVNLQSGNDSQARKSSKRPLSPSEHLDENVRKKRRR